MQGSSALPRLATGTAVGLSFLVTLTLGLPAHAIEEIPLATNTLSQSTDGAGVSAVALEGGGFAALWLVLGFPDSELLAHRTPRDRPRITMGAIMAVEILRFLFWNPGNREESNSFPSTWGIRVAAMVPATPSPSGMLAFRTRPGSG